ncbi:MAG: DUF58 domain-containing protein [Flavobacteriales bacterium]
MDKDYRQLFKPSIINSITGLSLIVRVIVDGYLSGLNKSRRVGVGHEFSQYRGYESGDDLRLLDWKMFARSGRYYIKQSEIDTHISVKFVVDASKSMVYTEDGVSKLDYVKVMIASLAHLAQAQGDAIGLYALNTNHLISLQPKVHKQQYKRFLHELIHLKGDGIWPSNTVNFDQFHDRSRKELVFFITDMYENDGELTTMIKSLKTKRNEVVVLQIMGKKELQFNYKGFVVFEDLETGAKVKVDAKQAKSIYLSELNTMMTTTKDMLLSNGIGYQQFTLDEPIGEALQLFLKQRSFLM